jgi:RNA polymerase sigma-70 factor, ECF subfamily
MMSVVGIAGRKNQDESEFQTRTLGDLLYARKGQVLVSEGDWVRLVQSVATGDQLALHSLYERTHRLVFTLILRITNNRETAEEVTLDVFQSVWRRAASYDPAGGSVLGWIMNQARSRAIDRLRFEQRKKRINSHEQNPLSAVVPDDPQRACQIREQNLLLAAALQLLTAEERQVIETAFFLELTYQEVATKLNLPVGTVKTRIRSGLGKLRQTLGRMLQGI